MTDRLAEIEETFRIHSELAPSQIEWLISEVKRLGAGLDIAKEALNYFSKEIIYEDWHEGVPMITPVLLNGREIALIALAKLNAGEK